jgi:hypothetical protein
MADLSGGASAGDQHGYAAEQGEGEQNGKGHGTLAYAGTADDAQCESEGPNGKHDGGSFRRSCGNPRSGASSAQRDA